MAVFRSFKTYFCEKCHVLNNCWIKYDSICTLLLSIIIHHLPTQVLIAIKTTEVGVETFSLTLKNTRNTIKEISCNLIKNGLYLKSKLRIEKEQISTPLPVMAEKIPPIKPVTIKTKACQIPKFCILSIVRRLCCLKP